MSRDGPPARPAPGRARWRSALVVATDVAIALAFAAAVAIAVTGGFRGEVFGVTVSARGADRAFAAAFVLVLARRRWAGGVGLFGSTPEATRRVVAWRVLPSGARPTTYCHTVICPSAASLRAIRSTAGPVPSRSSSAAVRPKVT